MKQRSFLKWAGGKSSALNDIFIDVPVEGKCLVEPFVGSASVALNTNYDEYLLSDTNADLINLFKLVVKNPNRVVKLAKSYFIPENNNINAFYELRDLYNNGTNKESRAILFMYLNRHCFNGLMRYNQSGGFNTSFGKYKEPLIQEEQIFQFSEKFKGKAKFKCSSFENLKFTPSPDTVVYSDPPYLPLTPTASFCAYGKNKFVKPQHMSLDRKSASWAKQGCKTFVSNHKAPGLGDCYSKWQHQKIFSVSRTISRDVTNRSAASEVLMIY